MKIADVLKAVVGGIVLALWAVGYVLSYLPDSKVKAPAEMTPIVLAVVAYLFAREIKARLTGGKNDEEASGDDGP